MMTSYPLITQVTPDLNLEENLLSNSFFFSNSRCMRTNLQFVLTDMHTKQAISLQYAISRKTFSRSFIGNEKTEFNLSTDRLIPDQLDGLI